MATALTLLLAAALLDQAPREITGALGVQLGAVVGNAELNRLGFSGGPDGIAWRREEPGHFPVISVQRARSGRVLGVVMVRRWPTPDGNAACRTEQAAFERVIASTRPALVRVADGPPDILFVTFWEPGERRDARSIAVICSHIPGSVPPTLRISWRVSPAEREAAYAEAPVSSTE